MALGDSGEPINQKAGRPMTLVIDMKFVPALPGGRTCFPAEREGKLVWLIAQGAMSQECFQEMRNYLLHIAASGKWTQNWDGEDLI